MDKIFNIKIVAIVGGISLLLLTIIISVLIFFLFQPASERGHDQVIIINEGMSLGDVATILAEERLIRNKPIFMLWARILGHSRRIKAGEYQMSHGMTPHNILEMLSRGTIISHAVTIPEGYSTTQIADLFAEKGLIHKQQFLELTKNRDFMKKYDISSPSLEGYLYPDTYQFGRGLSAELIIDTMVKRFRELVLPYKKSASESGMTWNEIITLASIVEKETGKAEERPLIASVFLNRLKKRMRIESDPTVIYGIENFNGNLTRKDLSKPTPYNTYVIWGLPPGPIANPGLDAIKAVLNPAQTDYLYFVSKNDGFHYFSKTLKEHNRAVQIYQKRKKKRKNR